MGGGTGWVLVTITIVHEVKYFLYGIFLRFHYYVGGGHLIWTVILYSGITINTLFGQNAKFMKIKAGDHILRYLLCLEWVILYCHMFVY
jgi:hypothetical protein